MPLVVAPAGPLDRRFASGDRAFPTESELQQGYKELQAWYAKQTPEVQAQFIGMVNTYIDSHNRSIRDAVREQRSPSIQAMTPYQVTQLHQRIEDEELQKTAPDLYQIRMNYRAGGWAGMILMPGGFVDMYATMGMGFTAGFYAPVPRMTPLPRANIVPLPGVEVPVPEHYLPPTRIPPVRSPGTMPEVELPQREPAPIAQQRKVEYAINEWGKSVAAKTAGGYHGVTEQNLIPEVLFKNGMKGGGSNRNLAEHVVGAEDSAFMGLAPMPGGSGSTGLMTPVEFAGEGGWVVEIRGVPGWDTTLHAPKAVAALSRGEAETATLRNVEGQYIYRVAQVVRDNRGNLLIRKWVYNNDFIGYK